MPDLNVFYAFKQTGRDSGGSGGFGCSGGIWWIIGIIAFLILLGRHIGDTVPNEMLLNDDLNVFTITKDWLNKYFDDNKRNLELNL